jgi:hypothetical protein
MSQTTRIRARQSDPVAPAADTTPRHTAKLVKGLRYDLLAKPGLWPDQAFLAGTEVEVSAEVFDHLGEHTLDKVSFRSGNDVIVQQVRKFRLQARRMDRSCPRSRPRRSRRSAAPSPRSIRTNSRGTAPQPRGSLL